MLPSRALFAIKALLLRISELAVLLFGCVVSFIVLMLLVDHRILPNNVAGLLVFIALVLTPIVGFFLFRRKTSAWKIKCDAARWQLSQIERKLHPKRARYKRIARRILIWVPSAIAAIVLFFFPVMTHLAQPRAHFLTHFRVPIPWSFAVTSHLVLHGGWSYVEAIGNARPPGLTLFLDVRRLSSDMLFGTIQPDADTFAFNHRLRSRRRAGATVVVRKDFRIGEVPFSCWQYFTGHDRWNVDCETPVDVHKGNLYASFVGRAADIPAFYNTIAGITPIP